MNTPEDFITRYESFMEEDRLINNSHLFDVADAIYHSEDKKDFEGLTSIARRVGVCDPTVSVKKGKTSLTGEYVIKIESAVKIAASTISRVFLFICKKPPYKFKKLPIIFSASGVRPDDI